MVTRLILAGSGLALLVFAAWYIIHNCQPSGDPGLKIAEHYLFCPECKFEMPCSPEVKGKEFLCPRCGKNKIIMEFSDYSHVNGFRQGAANIYVPVTAVGAIAFMALLWVLFARRSQRGKQHSAGSVHICRCRKCGRKIAYETAKAGLKAQCPRCREVFTLPA
jgi:phage FluMu protein Com